MSEPETDPRWHSRDCWFHLHNNPDECNCHKAGELFRNFPPPDHNGGWEPPLG